MQINPLATDEALDPETIRREHFEYKMLYEYSPEMHVSVKPPDGVVTKCNQTLCDRTGFSKEEIIGKPVFWLYHDSCRHEADAAFKQFMKSGKVVNYELSLRTKDNQAIPVLLNVQAIRDEHGNILYSNSVWQDITDLKELEKEQREVARLQRINSELEQFTYIASHDLREPLNTITGSLRLMQSELATNNAENVDTYLSFMQSSATRMEDLILSLLDYSRLGVDRNVETVNCNETVNDVLSDLETQIVNHNVELEVDALPLVSGNKTELRLLFQNLISNAIKFGKPDQKNKIQIHAESTPSFWQFCIQDDGIGIAEKYHNKIFTIFQRLNARDDYSGTGIGLAHCKKIVDLHSGRIWVESQPNCGASFLFTLPKN